MIITEKMKELLLEIILDLDRHFPTEVLNDEYYERFFNKYIKPCIKEDRILEE